MKFVYMLAPLEDVTDNTFRELCYTHGADLTFTEMTLIAGLVRHNNSTMRKAAILNTVPTQIQLSGQREDELKKFLNEFNPMDGFQGFNFNLGCPSVNQTNAGLGCALIRRVSKVDRMVTLVKKQGYPCSIKMRLGLNQFEKKKKVYVNLIKEIDADFFAVHARHGKEHYEVKPDETVYPECVDTGKVIIANGDVDAIEKVRSLKKIGVMGVMIGRAAIRNPAIFERLKGMKETPIGKIQEEYKQLAEKYAPWSTKYLKNVLLRMGKEQVGEKGVRG